MKNFFRTKLFLLLAFLFVFLSGWQVGWAGFQLNLRLNPVQITVENKTPPSSTVDFSLLWKVLDRINHDFLFRTAIDGKKLLYGAISGLVSSLGDPYTAFLTPDENKAFSNSLEGVYEGIGAEIGMRENQLIVVAPLDGSPAAASGVHSGDKILEIDGVSASGLTISEAVAKIRGKAGTNVTLTLQRGNDPSFKVTITRAQITVKSVKYVDEGNGIFLIGVSRFGDKTNEEWDEAVSAIKSKTPNPKGIILDLRNDPGGYLSSSVYLASEFVSDGPIVLQEDASGSRQTLSAVTTKNNHAFAGIQVVVLINGGSASASEILAGALRERVSAKLVGEKSFGKGTVQDAVDFDDGSGLHLTIAKWLTPSGLWIHGIGLEPDFKVELSDADQNAGRDPQLDKALSLLR